jgi:hypothetical protein
MMNRMLRHTVVCLAMLPVVPVAVVSAIGQQSTPAPRAGSNWQHVQELPEGTSIRVKAPTRSAVCNLKSVDADSLTCVHGIGKDIVFQRTEIQSIKIHHRARSAAAGAGIGFVAGVSTGYGLFKAEGGGSWGGLISTGAGVGFGVIGAVIGVATDFTHSTVYKGP